MGGGDIQETKESRIFPRFCCRESAFCPGGLSDLFYIASGNFFCARVILLTKHGRTKIWRMGGVAGDDSKRVPGLSLCVVIFCSCCVFESGDAREFAFRRINLVVLGVLVWCPSDLSVF